MTSTIPILRARVGQTNLALELRSLVSLMDPDQLDDIEVIAVSGALGEEYRAPAAVALVHHKDQSVGLGFDEIAGYEQWDPTRVAVLPRWVARHLPSILKPACGLGDDGQLVWILHPPAFLDSHSE